MFVPGQLVVCIAEPIAYFGETVPRRGVVYTTRATRRYGDGVAGIRLAEIRNEARPYDDGFDECWFNARNFRPLDDYKLDVFRSVLTDAPKDLEPVE